MNEFSNRLRDLSKNKAAVSLSILAGVVVGVSVGEFASAEINSL
jgi:hypothetical protein